MKAFSRIAFVSVTLGFAGIASAQRGPPPEALEACAGKTVQTQCQMNTPRGELSGQCVETPRGQMVCLPEGHQAGMGGQQGQNGQRPQRQGLGKQMSPGSQVAPSNQNNARRGNGGAGRHTHTVTQSSGKLNLFPANIAPITQSRVVINEQSGYRIIQSNGISQHKTGTFPNSGNPNRISEQKHEYRVPLNPQLAGKTTQSRMGGFGIAVNGVMFDPGAAETFETAQDWHYEALSGAVPLGIDANHAHVQPTGKYHYHGKPTGLMQKLGVNPRQHSQLIGWAADGFPIYALYGYKNGQNAQGGIQKMTSSSRLKAGKRPGGSLPSGNYDGTFVKDFEYIAGSGTLDECNGRMTVTPEFPKGTYAYFLTDTFPVVPRCFKGTPSQDFTRHIPIMGRRSF